VAGLPVAASQLAPQECVEVGLFDPPVASDLDGWQLPAVDQSPDDVDSHIGSTGCNVGRHHQLRARRQHPHRVRLPPLAYDTPRGSVFRYMPELNVLCAIADHSVQSGQPLTKQIIVEVTPAAAGLATSPTGAPVAGRS